ncbi:Guanine nucleotide exchange factor for Cdc42p [Umbelopsis sp. WA50703]
MAQQIELPTPTNIHSSKPASLYHTCLTVLDKLACIPGFDYYEHQDVSTPTSLTVPLPTATVDPVSKLWNICRKGSSLCFLFNTLRPHAPVKVNEDASLTSANACKANVYHFIVGCQKELHFSDDDLFTICDLTQDDTNGFVKVVHTVSKILDMMEVEHIIKVPCIKRVSDPGVPKDIRAKIVNELVETERKFVQDMEALQDYMREIQTQKILPPDTIHYLFSNLNALVDFQRKFLIKIEEIAEQSPETQRFGHLFIQMESVSSVYDVFCANYPMALDLVIQETPKLQKLVDIANPTYELQSLLIKPVQRLCKYPLLMQKLIEETNVDWPYHEEMKEGYEAISRAASRVNEVSRRIENQKCLEVLKQRVDDWRGLSVDQFGKLLLDGKFIMSSNDAEKELLVYLFDKILIICKEMKEGAKSRLPKTNSIGINKKKRRASLLLKGKIFVSFIIKVVNTSSDGVYSLKIYWQNNDVESFSLKCRNEEDLQRWESTLNNLLGETNKRQTAENGFDIKQYSTNWQQLSANGNPINTVPGSNDEDDEPGIDENDDEEDYDCDGDDNPDRQYRARSGSVNNESEQAKHYINKHRATGGMAGVPGAVPMRHYNTTPGMTLPPLPRSNYSTTSASTPTSQTDYNRYPASPPPSMPSSPTSSARASSGSNSTINVWQRRNMDTQLTDTVAKFMIGDEIPTPTDENRSYATIPIGRTQSQTPTGAKKSGPYGSIQSIQMRSRSKSSPDVHKSRNSWGQMKDHDAYGLPFVRPPPFNGDVTSNQVKIKLNYPDGIYVIRVESQIKYTDLLSSVARKIGSQRLSTTADSLRLKYQDEEGDLITINSDEDVQMGIEARGTGNTVNLFVSC